MLAQECIDSANKFGIQPEIFPATWGDDVDKHFSEQDLKVFKKGQSRKEINPGLKGCLLSHYRLWKKCIASAKPMMIFEHDNFVLREIAFSILFSSIIKSFLQSITTGIPPQSLIADAVAI